MHLLDVFWNPLWPMCLSANSNWKLLPNLTWVPTREPMTLDTFWSTVVFSGQAEVHHFRRKALPPCITRHLHEQNLLSLAESYFRNSCYYWGRESKRWNTSFAFFFFWPILNIWLPSRPLMTNPAPILSPILVYHCWGYTTAMTCALKTFLAYWMSQASQSTSSIDTIHCPVQLGFDSLSGNTCTRNRRSLGWSNLRYLHCVICSNDDIDVPSHSPSTENPKHLQ